MWVTKVDSGEYFGVPERVSNQDKMKEPTPSSWLMDLRLFVFLGQGPRVQFLAPPSFHEDPICAL